MKRALPVILLCLLCLLLCALPAAQADALPEVSLSAAKLSVNGSRPAALGLTASAAFPEDTHVTVACKETGETWSVLFSAGETRAELILATEQVTKNTVRTLLLQEGEGYAVQSKKAKCTLTLLPLPNVIFNSSTYIGYVGRRMSVRVTCKNPGAVVKGDNVFELRDQTGRLYASAEWKNPSRDLTFVFDVKEDMAGGLYFSVWWNRIRVTKIGGGYAAIADLSVPVVSKVDTDKPYMAITLDCCYYDAATDDVLAVLDQYGVKCTFFLTGFFERVFPESARKILDHGHEIGNHSTNHRKMTSWKVWQQISQLTTPIREIQDLLGVTTRLYRPPFGNHNQSLTALSRGEGMEVIMWTVDSHDWDSAYRGKPEKILERVKKACGPGCIVLHHLDGSRIAYVLGQLIPYIQNDLGLQLVTVSELLALEDHPMPQPRPVDNLTELPPDLP